MPVPYRKTPRAAEIGHAAYLDILWKTSERAFYGGLMVIDGKGQPIEFVHNRVDAPSGMLWPEEKVRSIGTALLAHTLFDACRCDTDLLICLPSLGSSEYCKTEIAPSIPFVQAVPEQHGAPVEWEWINSPPPQGMRSSILAQELIRRGFIIEPFDRLNHALKILYPQLNSDGV